MHYLELKEKLKDWTVFSLGDIKKIEEGFHRRRLNEWQDKGYITKVIKGQYIFSDLKLNENALFEIANRIYIPSYISFEMALSYYGFIPESVYGITSASSRRTYVFQTKIGQFSYRSIKPDFFFGYGIIRYGSKSYKIASAEKALLDYFYLNPDIKTRDSFAGLRINKSVFYKVINQDRLFEYLEKFSQKILIKRIKLFMSFLSMERD